MRNIWFHGFKVMCILCTRLTGMTKLVGDVMGKLLDFTEKAIFLFVGAKLTVQIVVILCVIVTYA